MTVLNDDAAHSVLRLSECDASLLPMLLAGTGLSVQWVARESSIPGSHWGDEEAGLIGHTLYVRADTPLHSALHEACHWLVMDPQRRAALHTDAKGSQAEENAVCYLQVLLAARCRELGCAQMSIERMCADMDAWGYNFMAGGAAAWYLSDANDEVLWLREWAAQGFAQQTLRVLFPTEIPFQSGE